MKTFSKALVLAAFAASSFTVEAKRGKMFEANAYITPKRENQSNQREPYLEQNLLNLRQVDNEIDKEKVHQMFSDLGRTTVTGGV